MKSKSIQHFGKVDSILCKWKVMELKRVQKWLKLNSIYKVAIFLLYFLISFNYGHAQKHDHNWIFGYNGDFTTDTISGSNFIHFDDYEFYAQVPSPDSGLFDFAEYCVNYSDKVGNLLFYSNGIKIWDRNHKEMEGSDGFNEHEFHRLYDGFGLPLNQGGIVLPEPDHDSIHFYIHMKLDYYEENDHIQPYGLNLYYSSIVQASNTYLDSSKSSIIISDTLERGGLSANRHANGRDWWVVMPRKKSNLYHIILIDPSGPLLLKSDEVGSPIKANHGVHQAHFSPDGSKYIRNSALHYTDVRDAYLDIYDFDRCTGTLSNHRQFQYADDAIAGGNAISPNSRFLYAHQGERLYQYDLEADDIQQSAILVGEYDGYLDQDFFTTSFYNMQLAPDDKIYMTCISGIKPMHVIHYPNKKGLDCGFDQRGIFLPRSNTRSVPNHPNYRLGPIDDSLCDTLGIDNIPLAGWRHRDHYLEVEFTSVCDYEPATWTWDFGDGSTSQDTCPIHHYMKKGTYEVCLTVSNVHGEDTYCKTISVKDSLSAVEIVNSDISLSLYPNPAHEQVQIYSSIDLGQVSFDFYNTQGQHVLSQKDELNSSQSTRIDLIELNAGVYFLEVKKGGLPLKKMKLVLSY